MWEYYCVIAPKSRLLLLSEITAPRWTRLLNEGLWGNTRGADILARIPAELPREPGWTKHLTIVRLGGRSFIHVFDCGVGTLDVELRIGLHFAIKEALRVLARLCTEYEWCLVDDDLQIITADDYTIIESIQRSRAFQFLEDPVRFLSDLRKPGDEEPGF